MRLSQVSSVSRQVDLYGKISVTLQVWARAKSFSPGDTATCSVSADGVSWAVVNTWVVGDADNTYHLFNLDLSSYPLTSTFQIAFGSNFSTAVSTIYFDYLQIIGQ